MTKEFFDTIKQIPFNPSDIDCINVKGNKDVYRRWFYDEKLFHRIPELINYDGNSIRTNYDGLLTLRKLIYFEVFTDEEWDIIIPYIFFCEFNSDFDDVVKKVIPLFRKIEKYYDYIFLEIWQGIFSFNTHWATAFASDLYGTINSKSNGKLYCDTLVEIYPYISKLINKYERSQYTLFRLVEKNKMDDGVGILYQDRILRHLHKQIK